MSSLSPSFTFSRIASIGLSSTLTLGRSPTIREAGRGSGGHHDDVRRRDDYRREQYEAVMLARAARDAAQLRRDAASLTVSAVSRAYLCASSAPRDAASRALPYRSLPRSVHSSAVSLPFWAH